MISIKHPSQMHTEYSCIGRSSERMASLDALRGDCHITHGHRSRFRVSCEQ